MDWLDLIVVGVAIAAAVGGYRLGFVGRVASWLGLALGFYVAVRLLPSIIVDLSSSSPGTQLAVAVLLLVGGAMVGQALGLLVGSRLHHALPLGPVRQVDRVVGSGVGVVGVVAALWLLLPSIAAVPGWPARATAGSGISRWVSVHLPAPPDALQVLRRLIGQDAPQVFAVLHPGASAGAAPGTSPLTPALTASVVASTVKVEGQACNRIFEGSGFAVATDLIVTNAHVVAGEPAGQTTVLLPSGARLGARVVMFDSRRDLALLQVNSWANAPCPCKSLMPARPERCSATPMARTRWPSPPPGSPRRRKRSAGTSTTAATPGGTSWSWPPPSPTATLAVRSSMLAGPSSGWPSPSPPTSPAPPTP